MSASSSAPILVLGATGRIGSEVVRQLLAQSNPVAAAVRNVSKAKTLLPSQVQLLQADFSDPASVQQAASSVQARAVFLYASAVKAELLSALKAAGVQRAVLLSGSIVGLPVQPTALQTFHQRAEEAVSTAGLSFTIVRGDSFASNALHWKESIAAAGIVNSPHPDAPHTLVATEDVAAVIVQALTSDSLTGQTVIVVGPEAVTERQQVVILSEELSRPIRLQEVTEDEWRQEWESHIPSAVIDNVFVYHRFRQQHGVREHARADRVVTGSVSFRQWVQRHSAEFTVSQ